MNWQDFLNFRKMVTPVIIKIIFWLGVAAVVLFNIVYFFILLVGGISHGEAGRIILALLGIPIGTVLELLFVRIYTELLIVMFSIHDRLVAIEELLRQRGV